jgi:hypothetical protein
MSGGNRFDGTSEEREAEYRLMAQALDLIVSDVRAHRAEGCHGGPLCPGAAAANKVHSVPSWRIGELLMTCLAGLADREERIEASARLAAEAADRHVAQVAHLERELAAARRDGEAGWAAYREAEDGRRELARNAVRVSLPHRHGASCHGPVGELLCGEEG